MSNIKGNGTDIELHLFELVRPFWATHRYRKNYKKLPGRPDLVFLKAKLIVFADGDFWHGKGFDSWRSRVPDFWKLKIEKNIERDKRQTKLLKLKGYNVLRFWGSDIKKHPERVLSRIEKYLNATL